MKDFVIDGRQFHGITQELSAAQENYVIGQLRLAGAIDCFIAALEKPDDAHAEELLTKLLVSGRAPHVLAGCLTEAGKAWTFDEAQRNAARFASTTKAEDKAAMQTAIVGFVVGFFHYSRFKSATTPQNFSGLN